MSVDTSVFPVFYVVIIYVLTFFIGAVLGSFINVIAYRIPLGRDFKKGRSACTDCNHTLTVPDLVPVFSYVFLRGKCRYCGARISPIYPAAELLGGAAAVLSVFCYGLSLVALAVFVLLCGLLAITLIDIRTMEIPNGMQIFILIPALALVFLLPGVSYVSHAIGLVCISVPMLLIALAKENAFGGGDIKMMAICGLALGWQRSLLAFLVALVAAIIPIIIIYKRKNGGRSTLFAFGPCLALGVCVSLLFGDGIVLWYLGLLGF